MGSATALNTRVFFQSTAVLLVVGFLALIASVAATIWLSERAQVQFGDVIDARDARSAATELRNAMQTAESSQRGFLVTGNEIYLAPYDAAKALAVRQLATLKRLLARFRESDIAIERLTAGLNGKIAEMDQTIALKRDRQDAEAVQVTRTNRGKALMDEANVFLTGIILSSEDRLTDAAGGLKDNTLSLRRVSTTSALVIVLVAAIVAVTVFRYTRQLAAARSEVNALNAGLEQRVTERTAELVQANEEIQRFAYIVTHDLRAPLINITGFVSELEDGLQTMRAVAAQSKTGLDPNDPVIERARVAAETDLPEAIGFIRSSTRKMNGQIDAILKLSREGRRTLQPEAVRLETLIQDCAAAVQHQMAEAGGELHLDIAVPVLTIDRMSLEQIFGNLFDNAVKYRAKSRPLRIDVRAMALPGDQVAVEFADNGRGIAEQDKGRIFELFRRAGAQDQPGEGIGLAFVLTILRNIGGHITVTSVLDQGTTFRIVLPRDLPRA